MCDELRWLVDPFSCACTGWVTGSSPRSLDICTMTELPMTPQGPINHLKLIHDGHENTRQMVQARPEQIQELQSSENKLRVQALWVKVQKGYFCKRISIFIFKVLMQTLKKFTPLSWLKASGRNPKKSIVKSQSFYISNSLMGLWIA